MTGSGGDLQGSAQSAYGSYGGGYGLDPGSCFSLDICPDLILAAIAAAAAAAAFLIYNAIVAAGRRRKRSQDDSYLSFFLEELAWGILRHPTVVSTLGLMLLYYCMECRPNVAYAPMCHTHSHCLMKVMVYKENENTFRIRNAETSELVKKGTKLW